MLKAVLLALSCMLVLTTHASAASDSPRKVDVPAGDLAIALELLARQAGAEFIYSADELRGLRTQGVQGEFTAEKAVAKLLEGTKLKLTLHESGAFLISAPERATHSLDGTSGSAYADVPPPAGNLRLAQEPSSAAVHEEARENERASITESSQELPAPDETGKAIPEVLVEGSKSLNMDIERTRDDVLPYVVFDRKRIEQSGATNIEEFFKRRLPMNTLQASFGQTKNFTGNRSQINLRGLGANQTLILIDGRRTSNTVFQGGLRQQDLNGIPLSAVERIEVLPATASGIYGGDATGGVVNIILRRDYQGAELKVGWDSAVDVNDGRTQVELSSGFNLEGGKTSIMVMGSWSEANELLTGDRDFVQQYRDEAFANRPALYLPPAIQLGYTTNIRSTSGNLVLDNGTPLNSNFTSVPVGYAGVSSDAGAGLVANAGRYNLDLADTAQGTEQGGQRQSMLTTPKIESINATVRRQFSPDLQAFLDLGASNNTSRFDWNTVTTNYVLPPNAPNNPFQQQIQVSVPIVGEGFEVESRHTDRRIVGGVIGSLPWEWKAELDYVWSRTASSYTLHGVMRDDASNAINTSLQTNANLNPLRDTNVFPLDFSPYLTQEFSGPFETTTKDTTLVLGGPVGRLPGGRPTLNIRLANRNEKFGGGTSTRLAGSATSAVYPDMSQSVRSAYLEIRLPLVSPLNGVPLVEELELQLSARRDDYTINGASTFVVVPSTTQVLRFDNKLHSTNPTMGLRWKPVQDVVLRASYGTGFLPPNVTQLVPSSSLGGIPGSLIDPRRGDLPIGANILNARRDGGNPDLRPEESENWSAGLILAPRWVPGLRLSVDLTHVEFTDRIGTHPQALQGIINDEALFPGRITRGTPTPAEAAMGWAGPIQFMDFTLMNISLAQVEAYDVQLDYTREMGGWGTLDFYTVATWQPDSKTQTREGQPIVDNSGFRGGLLEYKGNAGLTWNQGGLSIGWLTNYFDSYVVYTANASPTTIANSTQAQGATRVPHQIYHDAFATYRFSGHGLSLLDGAELTLGLRNVLNTKPPRDQQSYSTYGDPRLSSYFISVKKSFAP